MPKATPSFEGSFILPGGAIYDRNGKLLVYNKPTYDVMMVVREMKQFDTLDFCNTLNINIDRFHSMDAEMRDRRKNPGYSSYTPQLFMSQLDLEEYGLLQEKLYKFPGVYIQSRTERQYNYPPNMGLILGYIAEVDKNKMAADPYYVRGDYVGKSGIELSHEEDLRGAKRVWRYCFAMHTEGSRDTMRAASTTKRHGRERTLHWLLIWNCKLTVSS